MNSIQALTLSKKKYLFNILDSIEAEIEVSENPYDLPIDELFTMAARINKKRSFLFVSKLIGKHIPINPRKGFITSALLAARYYEAATGKTYDRKEELLSSFFSKASTFEHVSFIPKTNNPLIIGFAETATALGHAFFDCFMGAEYFHTTRESVEELTPVITFEEEHSHATSHRCYIPMSMIKNEREIILVDDELTTGKTAINIIQSIHSQFPRKKYTVVSILDWRSEENKHEFKRLEASLGIKIDVISLLAGSVTVKQIKELENASVGNEKFFKTESNVEIIAIPTLFSTVSSSSPPYLEEIGRFGMGSKEKESIDPKISEVAAFLSEKRIGDQTLCLGTGEFMYIPMKIASQMGEGVYYHSTTRSPIYIKNEPSYGARFGISFPNPEDQSISHFVYNIPPNVYDDLFLFFEREVELQCLEEMVTELKKTNIKSIKIIFFAKKEV
jgi:hypothetical protein